MKVTIKALRVNADMNQKQAADALGVNVATLVKWEANRTSPTGTQLARMCKLYGCTLDDIFLPDNLTKS